MGNKQENEHFIVEEDFLRCVGTILLLASFWLLAFREACFVNRLAATLYFIGAVVSMGAGYSSGNTPHRATDATKTRIELIVDRSGSMRSMGSEVQGGVNAFLKEQHDTATTEGRVTATLTTFDNKVECVWRNCDIGTGSSPPIVTAQDVAPRGATALLDAIGQTLHSCEKDTSPADRVIVVILTDGAENASQDYTKADVMASIERLKRDRDWTFVFLGANQDAINTGSSFGIGRDACMTFGATPAGQRACFASASACVARKRAGNSTYFTPQERVQSMDLAWTATSP